MISMIFVEVESVWGYNTMKKKNVQAIIGIIFTSILVILAMTGGRTDQEEIRQLRDAMRNLRRVDNIAFSYTTVYKDKEETERQIVDIWADQLSGSWVSEQYMLDEDGMRLVQKKFCDGDAVYTYMGWNGDWQKAAKEDMSVPYLAAMTVLDYDGEDVTGIESVYEDNLQKVSYSFTPEYLNAQLEKRISDLEKLYQRYEKSNIGEAGLYPIQLAIEQYKEIKQENVWADYVIDTDEVLCKGTYIVELRQPELIKDGQDMWLGDDQDVEFQVEIEVKGYSQNGILNKIEQCRNEAYVVKSQ